MSNDAVRGCDWEDVESALRRGWQVFPLWGIRGEEGQPGICACPAGVACREAGKHPAVSGGLLSAVGAVGVDGSAGAFQAAAWWGDGAERRNLGIRTGSVSRLLVMDVDIRSGGADSYDMWEDVTGFAWPVGGRVHTGRGGAESVGAGGHWYLGWSAEWARLERRLSGKVGVLPGIDVRADGGYVVGVGSAHVSGGRYQWLPGWGGREIPEASVELFSWLRDARSGGGSGGGSGGSGGSGGGGGGGAVGYSFKETHRAETVGAGGRDAYFNDLAFRLRLARFSWGRAEAVVREKWERTQQPVGDVYEWETALGKLERVWATIPAGGTEGNAPRKRVHVITSLPLSEDESPRPTPTADAEDTGDADDVAVEDSEDFDPDVLNRATDIESSIIASVLSGDIFAGSSEVGAGGGVEEDCGEGTHDTGNGLRFVRLFRGKARYVRELARWFCWDETDGVWVLDKVGRTVEWSKEVVADIRSDAEMARMSGDSEVATRWFKWAHSTSAMARRKTLLESASVEEAIRTEIEELDAGRWLMALRGGHTVDLETGEVRPSRADDLITRCAGVSWEEVEEARGKLDRGWVGGLWESHVLRMVKGDREAAAWLRRMAGYCLTGSVQEQSMAIMHGNGENGKNVFMETLCAVWGGYAIKAQAGILTAADDEHPVGLYGLRGARLVFVDEVGRSRINETRLKDITGGAVMRARDIGASWVEFEMQGKVWIAANALPAIRDSSHGMWRRIRNVSLYGQVGKDGWVREYGFAERLQSECRGEVMAWALDGLEEWRTTGLGTYAEMDVTSSQYRDEEDMFGLFIKECLEVDPPQADADALEGEWTDQRVLYQRYRFWFGLTLTKTDKELNFSYFGRELRKALPGLRTQRGREGGERIQRVYGVRLKTGS